MRIKFAPSARAAFLEGQQYIRKDDPGAARRLKARASKALQRLKDYPDSGRIITEFPELPFREVLEPPYRFFYRAKGKTIWIAAVWHEAQIPQGPA